MTWTIDNTEGERDRYYRATTRRSPRESTGRVIYPLEFWNHARPNVALNSGTPRSRIAAREDSREQSSPLSTWDRWYERNEGWLSIVLGCVGLAAVGYVGACLAMVVAAAVTR